MSHLNLLILAFSTNFCPNRSDLPGNTVWPQVSDFQKLAKMDLFWHFWLIFVHSKCKLCSLCWMRLFLWFSNTVLMMQNFWVQKRSIFAQFCTFNFQRSTGYHDARKSIPQFRIFQKRYWRSIPRKWKMYQRMSRYTEYKSGFTIAEICFRKVRNFSL